ncbi:putative reverse transcriptase domain-containing protein [Tanacetum coccineum]
MKNNPRDDYVQQPAYMRQNVARVYTAGLEEKKENLTSATNQRAQVANQRTLTCFECGKQGNYRSECLELKNQNHGN